jgi:hypothetical protein
MRKLLLLLTVVVAIDHLLLDGELVINQVRRLAS